MVTVCTAHFKIKNCILPTKCIYAFIRFSGKWRLYHETEWTNWSLQWRRSVYPVREETNFNYLQEVRASND
jgi:hypothetical protein